MSDDWGSYRRELGDEDEKDEGGPRSPRSRAAGPRTSRTPATSGATGPTTTSRRGATSLRAAGRPRARRGSGPTYDEAPREWQRSDYGDYPDYGHERRDDLLSDDAQAERYAARHSRDPLARLFPGLPHGVRVTLDWILTIAGAILIVLALKEWVVNPYRIPSSSMEPTLNCAKGAANPGCLGDSSDRVLACRICLDFGSPSRGDIVVFNTPSEAAPQVRRRWHVREARDRSPRRHGARGRQGLHLDQETRHA